MMLDWLQTGTKVLSQDGSLKGYVISGRTRVCSMEGCSGLRVAVRWPDKQITYPCSKGMVANKNGTVQIL